MVTHNIWLSLYIHSTGLFINLHCVPMTRSDTSRYRAQNLLTSLKSYLIMKFYKFHTLYLRDRVDYTEYTPNSCPVALHDSYNSSKRTCFIAIWINTIYNKVVFRLKRNNWDFVLFVRFIAQKFQKAFCTSNMRKVMWTLHEHFRVRFSLSNKT